jgi:L-ascorbate metabolism protein UlaG (beta-lactamase superfamily)
MLILAAVIFVFVAVVYFFLQLPAFGKNPSGNRLARVKSSANYTAKGFKNIEPTVMMAEGVSYPAMLKEFFSKGIDRSPTTILPSVKTNLDELANNCLVWFGHSSYFLRVANKNILVDPVLSERASPVQFAGIRAYRGANVYQSTDIPLLDAIIVTHDHYDHLDHHTIKRLHHRTKMFYTALGVGQHLERWGVPPEKIVEMDWWEHRSVFDGVELVATPARHFSGRGLVRNKTLWSSFVIRSGDFNIFIGGDSGYDASFKKIGDAFGPFDLAILESGQYDKKWPQIHMSPEDTVRASLDLKAVTLLPIHWGKFTLALHPWKEPISRVLNAAEKEKVTVVTPMIGAPLRIHGRHEVQPWWTSY